MPKLALIIPTLNGENDLPLLFDSVSIQTIQPNEILVIDSQSTDQTMQIAKTYGARCYQIPRHEFNHGGTRRLGIQHLTNYYQPDIYIFMTQDAYAASTTTFENLIAPLQHNPTIGCVYGRQLPKPHATASSIHGRLANYPPTSSLKYATDIPRQGIKTCFNSDNLAAYQRLALEQVGGFPKCVLTAEDCYVAAKLLLAGFGINYAAAATIFHSHNLTLKQEFQRYFSLGVFHRQESWIIQTFKRPTRAGINFVQSELKYLWQTKNAHRIPHAVLSTIIKYGAYQIGYHNYLLPQRLKQRLGINRFYWQQAAALKYKR